MQLGKEQSRQRIKEIRALWREWDPIGVYKDPESDCPPDEYDNYLSPCLRLLEQKVQAEELAKYLAYIVDEYMGLCDTLSHILKLCNLPTSFRLGSLPPGTRRMSKSANNSFKADGFAAA
jgi:hypothetical protein